MAKPALVVMTSESEVFGPHSLAAAYIGETAMPTSGLHSVQIERIEGAAPDEQLKLVTVEFFARFELDENELGRRYDIDGVTSATDSTGQEVH